jgi:hypothetical protein
MLSEALNQGAMPLPTHSLSRRTFIKASTAAAIAASAAIHLLQCLAD